jgi:hypothetical protein
MKEKAMKRTILALALLALVAGMASSNELQYLSVSATDTSQTKSVQTKRLTIVNKGANEVFVRVFSGGTPPAAATSSNAQIDSGESLQFPPLEDGQITAISIICSTGETATVRLYYW